MNNNNGLTLLEKYSPKTLEQLKLPVRISNLINENVDRQGYRFLFYGPPGTGKTSTAKLLVKDKEKHEVLYLSGSNDFNIAVLREKIIPFASAFSVMNKQKSIIVDECENIQDKIQDAFKIILDSSKRVNFIFITNEVEKVNTAIMSRCTQVEYNYSGEEFIEQRSNYLLFLQDIIKSENIKYENAGLKELYIKNFPDFRHSLITLQQIIDSKQVLTKDTVNAVFESGTQDIELYNLIENEKNPQIIYEKSTEYKGKEREAINSLAEPYFRYLNSKQQFENTLKAAVIVAKYSNMMSNTTTKFGTFFALVCELKTLFK